MDIDRRVNKIEYEMSGLMVLSKKIDNIEIKVDILNCKFIESLETTVRETALLNKKIDMYMSQSEVLCKLRHQQIDEYSKNTSEIRDKIAILWNWFPIQWGIIVLILSTILGSFWFLNRK